MLLSMSQTAAESIQPHLQEKPIPERQVQIPDSARLQIRIDGHVAVEKRRKAAERVWCQRGSGENQQSLRPTTGLIRRLYVMIRILNQTKALIESLPAQADGIRRRINFQDYSWVPAEKLPDGPCSDAAAAKLRKDGKMLQIDKILCFPEEKNPRKRAVFTDGIKIIRFVGHQGLLSNTAPALVQRKTFFI